MSKTNAIVALYRTHPEAEVALNALEQSGFDMKEMSVVGRDYHAEEHVIGCCTTRDRIKFWGQRGSSWGGLWAMLFGSGLLLMLIPGFGHVMVLGPLVGWIVGVFGEAAAF